MNASRVCSINQSKMVRSYCSIKFKDLPDKHKNGFGQMETGMEVAEMLWDALIVHGKIQLSKAVLELFMDDKAIKSLDEEGIANLLASIMENLGKVNYENYTLTNFNGKPLLYWTEIQNFNDVVKNSKSDKALAMHKLLQKMVNVLGIVLGNEENDLKYLLEVVKIEKENVDVDEEEFVKLISKIAIAPKENTDKPESKIVRECCDCHLTKSIDDFPEYKSYHATRCLLCHRAHRAKLAQERRAKKRALTVISDEGMGGVSCARCNKKTEQIKGKVCVPCRYEIDKLNKSSLETGQRQCISCTKMKDLSEFAKRDSKTRRNTCKACFNISRSKKSKNSAPEPGKA